MIKTHNYRNQNLRSHMMESEPDDHGGRHWFVTLEETGRVSATGDGSFWLLPSNWGYVK